MQQFGTRVVADRVHHAFAFGNQIHIEIGDDDACAALGDVPRRIGMDIRNSGRRRALQVPLAADVGHPFVGADVELRVLEGRGTAQSATYVVECDGGERYRCITRGRPFGEEPDTVCAPDASARLNPEETEQ